MIFGRMVVLMISFMTGSYASPNALCEGERKQAQITAQRIEQEWPLRSGTDPVTEYIRSLGLQLAKLADPTGAIPWHFGVVRNYAPNAYSIGAGSIFLTDGTVRFTRTESELAAIIAHEMGHQISGHFCQSPSSFNVWNLLLGRPDHPAVRRQPIGSLTQVIDIAKEQQADEAAVNILRSAGYDPRALLDLAKRLPSGGASAHLLEPQRIKALQDNLSGIEAIPAHDSKKFGEIKQSLDKEFAE